MSDFDLYHVTRPMAFKPLEIPTYGTVEISQYLRIPYQTLRYWTTYAGRTEPIIRLASTKPPLLSFKNVVECYVLESIRKIHRVGVPRIRAAVETLREKFSSKYPLADHDLQTDGYDLFIEEDQRKINLSARGQLGIPEVLKLYLRRIERDETGIAISLSLLTLRAATPDPNEPKIVVIDPTVSFGRPVIKGTGIPTAEISGRFHAGDGVSALAREYGIPIDAVEAAIRCEPLPAAA